MSLLRANLSSPLPRRLPTSVTLLPAIVAADVLPLSYKAVIGMAAGGIASVVGTPADVALVRMQADNMLPAAQRRNYTGVGNALTRIVREEGVLSLWRGAAPTVVRAIVLNAALLATADQMKEVRRAAQLCDAACIVGLAVRR